MPRSSKLRFTSILNLLALTITLAGCVTIGEGATEREFDATWDALQIQQSQSTLLEQLGEPRERKPHSAPDHDEVWIYSRLEVVGHKTEVSESAIGGTGVSIPTYEEVPINKIVEYHLRWLQGTLVSWERIED